MAWRIEYAELSLRALKKMDRPMRQRIYDFLNEVSRKEDVRSKGKALTGNLGGLWRYRVGDYRIVCDISEDILRILVVRVGHRSQIYR